ncbi:hypothetical protein [Calidithermus chliarophilus]|uniref:hypothetical protein n=1 Tax=Calidithermus chliarophilus TaxID=52023 RepID=UPI0003FDE83E|nr:hypothetical protein [Calidithermus chliarophilus]
MNAEKVDVKTIEGMDRVFEEITALIEGIAWIGYNPCGGQADYRYMRCFNLGKGDFRNLNAELIPALRARGVVVEEFRVGDMGTNTFAFIPQYPGLEFELSDLGGVLELFLYTEDGKWRSPEMPKGSYALVDLGTAARDAAWSLLYRAGYSPSRLRKAEQACPQARALQPHQYCLELGMSRMEFAAAMAERYFSGPKDEFWKRYATGAFTYKGELWAAPPDPNDPPEVRNLPPNYVMSYRENGLVDAYVIEDNVAYKSMRFAFSYTPHGEGGTLLVSAALR